MAGQKAAEGSHHDKLAWAAYVLGHHPLYVLNWLTRLWGAKDAVLAGKLSADDMIPIEADELIEAIHLVSHRVPIPVATAVAITSAAERLRQGCVDILRGLRFPDPDYVDWDLDYPSGAEQFPALVRGIQEMFKSQPHLETWRRLGELVTEIADSYTVFPKDAEGPHILTLLDDLIEAGDYPFLHDLQHAVERRSILGQDEALRCLFDAIYKDITMARFDCYLQRALREGARPEPWIELREKKVTFLGEQPHLTRFQLAIFWLLCETPRAPVQRWYMKDSCNFACSLDNIKSTISRLRDRLRPAIDVRFRDQERPAYADEAFIHTSRTGDGPYQLMLDASYVVLIPQRPDFMSNVPYTRTTVKSKRA
jgi:hypothetical protein